MYWNVIAVEPLQHLKLKVRFQDGLVGIVRFEESHLTGVFEALKDEHYFKQVFIQYGAVTWPGELDIAPDAMYAEIKKHGAWVLK